MFLVNCLLRKDCLKNLVSLLQMHRHLTYCKKPSKCRFNFPHPPRYSNTDSTVSQYDGSEDVTKCLGSVRKLLVEGKTDVSINKLLAMANTNRNDYEKAIYQLSHLVVWLY